MWAQALAIAAEMDSFPGGARALAQSMVASTEAMRPLRWPAERLDTLGGYLTFHNVPLFNLALAIYGALVGAKVLRGAEERHSAEELLATGTSRRTLLGGRTLGFVLAAALIAAGLSAGTALGMAGGGEPDLFGSVVTCATTGLVALVGFALGVLLGQVARDARTAGGAASALLVVLYLATNLDGQLTGAGVLAVVSPFTLANRSRALVPGHGLDPWSTLALVIIASAMLALAAVADQRRDYGSPLWRRQAVTRQGYPHVARFMVGSVQAAALREGAVGLAIWAAAGAALTAMMGALQPGIIDAWSDLGYLSTFGAAGSEEASYWAFATSLLPAVIAAYVVTRASAWVSELQHGRVEMLRSTGVSWTRLVIGRFVALLTGCAVIIVVAAGALTVVAASLDSPLDTSGTARVLLISLVFAAAMGSLAALVTAVVRRSTAIVILAVLVAGSYLLTYLVPLFGWPDWLNQLSLFWAFGSPYTGWPSVGRLLTLLIMASVGLAGAVVVAERSSSVP
jgi:ABC-2 type transport system permease protein